jgi:branched-chain amino acid transport system substrate-binding protein
MKAMKSSLLALAIAGAFAAGTAQAQFTGNEIKIGVLSDMSSLYTDLAGAG